MEEKTSTQNPTSTVVGKTESGKDIFFTPGTFLEAFHAQL